MEERERLGRGQSALDKLELLFAVTWVFDLDMVALGHGTVGVVRCFASLSCKKMKFEFSFSANNSILRKAFSSIWYRSYNKKQRQITPGPSVF